MRDNPSIRTKRIVARVRTGTCPERGAIPGIFRYARETGNWQLLFPGLGLGTIPTGVDSKEQLDGVLAWAAVAEDLSYRPQVIMGDLFPPLRAPTVTVDDEAVGVLAAKHLLSLGTKHIGYLGIETPWSLARTTAFEAEVQRHRRSCIGKVFPGKCHPDPDMIREWVRGLLFPIAVLAEDDFMAVKLVQAAQMLGIHVPEQMAVLGVNNDDLLCAAVVPALSSVAIPWDQMGYEAARRLDLAMQGQELPDTVLFRVAPTGIVQRGSTQVLAFGDPLVCDAVRLIRDRAARQAVTVDEIAAHFGIDRSQLTRTFQACAGFSPKQEIDRVRGDRLRELLSAGQLSVKRIAYEMGFPSAGELCRFCRRVLGGAPRDVRGGEQGWGGDSKVLDLKSEI